MPNSASVMTPGGTPYHRDPSAQHQHQNHTGAADTRNGQVERRTLREIKRSQKHNRENNDFSAINVSVPCLMDEMQGMTSKPRVVKSKSLASDLHTNGYPASRDAAASCNAASSYAASTCQTPKQSSNTDLSRSRSLRRSMRSLFSRSTSKSRRSRSSNQLWAEGKPVSPGPPQIDLQAAEHDAVKYQKRRRSRSLSKSLRSLRNVFSDSGSSATRRSPSAENDLDPPIITDGHASVRRRLHTKSTSNQYSVDDGRRNTVSTSYLERIGQRLGLVSRSQSTIVINAENQVIKRRPRSSSEKKQRLNSNRKSFSEVWCAGSQDKLDNKTKRDSHYEQQQTPTNTTNNSSKTVVHERPSLDPNRRTQLSQPLLISKPPPISSPTSCTASSLPYESPTPVSMPPHHHHHQQPQPQQQQQQRPPIKRTVVHLPAQQHYRPDQHNEYQAPALSSFASVPSQSGSAPSSSNGYETSNHAPSELSHASSSISRPGSTHSSSTSNASQWLNKQRPLPPPRVESSELEAPALPRQSCTTTQALNDIIASAMHQQQDQHRLHHYTPKEDDGYSTWPRAPRPLIMNPVVPPPPPHEVVVTRLDDSFPLPPPPASVGATGVDIRSPSSISSAHSQNMVHSIPAMRPNILDSYNASCYTDVNSVDDYPVDESPVTMSPTVDASLRPISQPLFANIGEMRNAIPFDAQRDNNMGTLTKSSTLKKHDKTKKSKPGGKSWYEGVQTNRAEHPLGPDAEIKLTNTRLSGDKTSMYGSRNSVNSLPVRKRLDSASSRSYVGPGSGSYSTGPALNPVPPQEAFKKLAMPKFSSFVMKRSASIDNDLISAQTAPSCIDGTKRYRDCNNTAIYAQPQHLSSNHDEDPRLRPSMVSSISVPDRLVAGGATCGQQSNYQQTYAGEQPPCNNDVQVIKIDPMSQRMSSMNISQQRPGTLSPVSEINRRSSKPTNHNRRLYIDQSNYRMNTFTSQT